MALVVVSSGRESPRACTGSGGFPRRGTPATRDVLAGDFSGVARFPPFRRGVVSGPACERPWQEALALLMTWGMAIKSRRPFGSPPLSCCERGLPRVASGRAIADSLIVAQREAVVFWGPAVAGREHWWNAVE